MAADAAASATSLLVVVPFVAADVPAMEHTRLAWERFPPCTRPGASPGYGLLFLHNRRCAASDGSDICAPVRRLMNSTAVRSGCFARVLLREARLSGQSDRYDKRRQSATWVAGPNNLFHFSVAQARRLGYSHMLQVETDVLPLRAGWLDRAKSIADTTDAWIVGSSLVANCTFDAAVRLLDSD